MSIKCFLLIPAGRLNRYLRRYQSSEEGRKCALPSGYHNAEFLIDIIEDKNPNGTYRADTDIAPFKGDPRFPTDCACGYEFTDDDAFQIHHQRLYRRLDTDGLTTLHEAPVGAMWYADWMLIEGSDHYRGPDGHCLVVRCPDGRDWTVDGRANNCDSPCLNCGVIYREHSSAACKNYQDARPHNCWVRHGAAPNITVNKQGITCGAGSGSIQTPGWHGFLRSGELAE